MKLRAALLWMAIPICIGAAFAAGAWWGGQGVEPGSATKVGRISPSAPRSPVPAVVASGMDAAVETPVTTAPDATLVAAPGTVAVADAVEQDPQLAFQIAAAASYAGAEGTAASPANGGPAGEQASAQSFEPSAPVSSGPEPWPAPSGAAAQLAIQSQASR